MGRKLSESENILKSSMALVSEQKVAHEAVSRGFDVYGPVCGAGKVDLIVYINGEKNNLQIKSTRHVPSGSCVPMVNVKAKKYQPGVIDAFVIHDAVRGRFYIVPYSEMPQVGKIHLTPNYDKYIDAWHLLEGGSNAVQGSSSISVSTDSRASGLVVESENQEPSPRAKARKQGSRRTHKGSSSKGQGAV